MYPSSVIMKTRILELSKAAYQATLFDLNASEDIR
jgi:hypothetical protein